MQNEIGCTNYVLAVSGGVDSVALAHLLIEAGSAFSIAHCNFKLRGTESDKDEQFVATLAAGLGVDYYQKSFDTAKYALEQGISIQMAARELRYSWFKELTVAMDACLITAHHANDVAETMLFNLSKGTGLAGLHGIKEYDGKTVRPLLWAKKEEILQFAQEHQLEWRDDLSNDENKYNRNRIRNNIIPEFEKINPLFIKAAWRTANRINDAEAALDFLIEQQNIIRVEDGHHFVDKEKLMALRGKSTILYRLINNFGFNYDQVDDILKSLSSTGAIFLSKNWSLNIDREDIIISQIENDQDHYVQLLSDKAIITVKNKTIRCNSFDRKQYDISTSPTVAALDLAKLKFPLEVRGLKQGDRFQPLGMKGTKLISDFLIDEKVPVALKQDEFVVISGDKIAWLAGRRIGDSFKITDETEVVFEIRLENT